MLNLYQDKYILQTHFHLTITTGLIRPLGFQGGVVALASRTISVYIYIYIHCTCVLKAYMYNVYIYVYIYTFFPHNIPSDYNRLYCLYTAKLVFSTFSYVRNHRPHRRSWDAESALLAKPVGELIRSWWDSSNVKLTRYVAWWIFLPSTNYRHIMICVYNIHIYIYTHHP